MSQSSCISHLLPALNKPHLQHGDIAPLIHILKDEPLVDVQLVGHSFENLPIHLLSLGQGPIVIFAWTQMHGNEATATAAVFDLIDQFLSHKSEHVQGWETAFTIHILPMVNPDGAQRCIRQNAQSIDINRDARELQTPEGNLLMSLVNSLAPNIGFNLHDQSPYYRCGTTANPATIAFLAPAFDVDKTIDVAREKAMLLSAHMNSVLQQHIPKCVARYDDTYSPRSFGDNIAAKNVSTILIESGAARGDSNRQVARSMNVLAMTAALDYLLRHEALLNTNNSHSDDNSAVTIADYFAIPENVSEALSSLVIRNLSFVGNLPYSLGVSIKQTTRYSNTFLIDFTGDLHTQAGLVDFNAQGLAFSQGKVYTPNKALILTSERYIALLRQGYLYMDDPQGLITPSCDLDICYASQPFHAQNAFILQQPAYCLLVDLQEPQRVSHALLNGVLIDIT